MSITFSGSVSSSELRETVSQLNQTIRSYDNKFVLLTCAKTLGIVVAVATLFFSYVAAALIVIGTRYLGKFAAFKISLEQGGDVAVCLHKIIFPFEVVGKQVDSLDGARFELIRLGHPREIYLVRRQVSSGSLFWRSSESYELLNETARVDASSR